MRIPFSPKWKRTGKCLNDAQLAAYVDGAQSYSERGRAESHLSKCVICRDSVSLLLRSERQVASDVPTAWIARVRHLGDARGARLGVRWAWAGASACLFIAALGITLASRPHPQDTIAVSRPTAPPIASNPVPSAEHDEVRNLARPATGPIVIAPAEGASVGRDLDVRWHPLATAVNYELRVLDAAGDTVWHSQTSADHLRIPAYVSLNSGQKYFVLISANLPTGKTVHARAVSFNVEAKQENR